MSQCSASHQLGHLEGLHNNFEYIRNQELCKEVFDLFQPNVDAGAFTSRTTDGKFLYG